MPALVLVPAPAPAARRWHRHRRAARHVGRGAHHLLRWFGSLAAVLILVALVAIWRLLQGPIELNWLAPYVEAAFDRTGMGVKVAVSGVRFGLDQTTQQLDLRATGVRVSLRDGAPLASFPEMATSFALGALLRGRLEPTKVVVERPVLHLVRDKSGAVSAQISSGKDAAPSLGPQMLETLAGPRAADAPLGLLRELNIRGATVSVEDEASGQSWQADRVDLSVVRSAKGVRGDFSLAVPLNNSLPEAHAYYRYFADRQVLDVDLSIDGVEPDDIPPLIPELAQLQHLHAPVSGTLRSRIDLAHRQALGSRLDLALGKGSLHSEWLPSGSVGLEQGEVHLVYAPEASEVRLEKIRLDLGGGAELVAAGTLDGVRYELIAAPREARPAAHVTARLTGALRHLPTGRLGELWPQKFAAGGRRWALANLHGGVLDEAALQVALDLDPASYTANLAQAHGSLRYHDVTVNYFTGLPMAHNVGGTAVFAGKRLDFIPTSGEVGGIKLSGGTLQITNLGEGAEWLTIDLGLGGPLQEALDIIDAKPLRYAHAIGIDPAQVAGRTDVQLHFRFPLLAALKLDQIEYGAKATVTGGQIGKVALNRGLSEANLALDLTQAGAQLRGNAKFDGTPAKLEASVPFHARGGPKGVYKIALRLDAAAQHRLDLDLAPDRIKGPIAADVTYLALAPGRGEATALLDLRETALAISEAGWKKPPDQPGWAKIVLDLDSDKISRISQVEVKAPGLDGNFTAEFSPDKKHIERVDIARLAVGDSEVSGTVRRHGAGWMADIHAPRIDAQKLLKDAASGTPSAASSPPLAVSARVDHLVLGPQRELQGLTANLVRSGGIWQSGRLDGRYVNGHRLSLRFGEEDGQRLLFQTDDLGAMLRAFDIADGIVGGKLTVDGQLTQVGGKRSLRAHVEGENYTLVQAPVMARILALPSFTGVASMLSGAGLPFAGVRGDVSYSGSVLTIKRLLAFGESLGVTADGWLDLDRDWLELHGTVAPAYMLNSMVGHVPVLGPLLGGGSQGLFAANYRLSGASGNPQVMVNPLSALAPGILRQLFDPIVGLPAAAQQ
ncbi:MAG: DUF3971 domain-containing protein [Thiohalocapsa sp.]